MSTIDQKVIRFRDVLAHFFSSCEEINDYPNLWDKVQNGQMTAYYENIFLCLVLRLIAKDGKIHNKEIDYLNRCFAELKGSYNARDLELIYLNSKEYLSDYSFVEWLKESSKLLYNDMMRQDYAELVKLICLITIQSDGEIERSEIEEAELILSSLD